MEEAKEVHVSKAEFDAFAEEVKAMVCALKKRLEEPKEVELGFYRCHEGGCDFVTEDLGVFVEHTVDMHLKKLGEEKTKPFHPTVKEYLECPECYPKFREAMLKDPRFLEELKKDGWGKEEEKPKRKALLS